MRLLVENATGHRLKRGRKIAGRGHVMLDQTDRPMATVTALRPVVVRTEPESPSARPRPTLDKPAYAIPAMAAIAAVPDNGRRVVSLFAGCGGSSLGYRMAGFRIAYANEFIEAARDSYRANASAETVIDGRDVRQVTGREILAATGLDAVDILDGSPPCAAFSSAGIRAKGWNQVKRYSDTAQRTDDLFAEYVRLVDELAPRVFVAENVAGLVKGVSKGHFIATMRRMKSLGYRVAARVLDAQWLGVPQARARLIFVGVREDLNREPAFPRPLPYRYSLREALPWLTAAVGGKGAPFDGKGAPVRLDAPAPTICGGQGARGSHQMLVVEPDADMRGYAVGDAWQNTAPGAASKRYFALKRPRLDAPSLTITQRGGDATAASVTHPTECRKFSIAELKRVCGFPDDFVLTGTYAQQWERLGRAVPPPMMHAIAATIRDEVFA